jgi:hypothetical protein
MKQPGVIKTSRSINKYSFNNINLGGIGGEISNGVNEGNFTNTLGAKSKSILISGNNPSHNHNNNFLSSKTKYSI